MSIHDQEGFTKADISLSLLAHGAGFCDARTRRHTLQVPRHERQDPLPLSRWPLDRSKNGGRKGAHRHCPAPPLVCLEKP